LVHSIPNYIGITRDGNIAVPEDRVDHNVCYAKLMQVGTLETTALILHVRQRADNFSEFVFKMEIPVQLLRW
jgi:hypothetical protein